MLRYWILFLALLFLSSRNISYADTPTDSIKFVLLDSTLAIWVIEDLESGDHLLRQNILLKQELIMRDSIDVMQEQRLAKLDSIIRNYEHIENAYLDLLENSSQRDKIYRKEIKSRGLKITLLVVTNALTLGLLVASAFF